MLRARRADRPARRRLRPGGRCRPGRGRRRRRDGAADRRALVRRLAVAGRGRGGPSQRRRDPARARERAAVPAQPRGGRAVADRRQRRHQRRRPARVQVRRDRQLGDRARGRGRARRARPPRRRPPQGRRRLRPAQPVGRLGGDARDHHRRVAALRAGARGLAPARQLLSGPRRRLRGDRAPRRQRRRAGGTRVRGRGRGRDRPPDSRRARRGRPLRGADRAGRLARPTSRRSRRRRSRRWPRAPSDGRRRSPRAGRLWRWRDGLSHAVTAVRGGRLGEDIVVPLDRLADVTAAVVRIGGRHGLEACSWGHAGDGNVHANFLVGADDEDAQRAAAVAAAELCDSPCRSAARSAASTASAGSSVAGSASPRPGRGRPARRDQDGVRPRDLFNPGKKT